jgi:signal transduction histidine kinase
MIRSARVKLTLAYTAGIALMMAAFSIALYLALENVMVANLDVGGNATAQVEQAVLAADLARARLALVGVNVFGWILSAVVSYVIAGRTLRPIESAVKRQRQFTAHASHELRTPLTIMEGEIDVTLARGRSPEEYRRTLDLVHAEVDHMKHSVDDMLTLAQVEARREIIGRERRVVAEVVDEVVRPLLARSREQEIRLTTDVSSRLEACLDWERIQHLLRNLLDNALCHTPLGGQICIDANQHGGDLELTVFNSGSHISADDLPHLFVPFYRGRETARGAAGAGLGLALSEWVARAHGGSIMAENRPGGVAFVVRLPRAT